MCKVRKLQFTGETIYCGLDAHKKNWKINCRMGGIELRGFSQNPDASLLSGYCKKHYPGAKVRVVYEAGFCGFGIQRSLEELGISCIVVNAADVPSSDKERKRKDDKRDARKLSRELSQGNLKGVYIPDIEMEQARTLVRQRYRLVQDQTMCKNRIKHTLMFSGVKLNLENERWTQKYLNAIEKADYKTEALKTALMKDPAMLMKYNEYRRRMEKNKAIIRIGKHLLGRIRFVWKNQKEYQRGIVGPDTKSVLKGIGSGIK
ncbi:IS110 family transposase [Niastella caeni]|uniref:IS110 family transposase n=1 Tax=Niastella caeni TaxID=2569763 RepID=A0A4S8HYA2_9BACT|nr:transposase [Niastella caeni]THU38212.1 IS110 family transposase [Niastella caeni]